MTLPTIAELISYLLGAFSLGFAAGYSLQVAKKAINEATNG